MSTANKNYNWVFGIFGKMASSDSALANHSQSDHASRNARVKKKKYVQLDTNFGPLTIELHSEFAPKTCEHFLRHCRSGHLDGMIFHRSVNDCVVCKI